MALQLERVVSEIANTYERISFVAHSLGACVLLKFLQTKHLVNLHKINFLAPALDQRQLQRYWFAQRLAKNQKTTQPSWETYRNDFNEQAFAQSCSEIRETKLNRMQSTYFLETSNLDYHDLLTMRLRERLSIVAGEMDPVVPLTSIRSENIPLFIVKNGDHDNEAPSLLEQWLFQTCDHLATTTD
jgi:predicted alpha/beta hydrolase family esterase